MTCSLIRWLGPSRISACGSSRMSANLPWSSVLLIELDRHQRTSLQPGLEILGSIQVGEDASKNHAPIRGIGNRGRASGKVSLRALLEVKDEVRRGEQIGVPVAPTRRAGQVNLVIHPVEPGFDTTRETT